MTDNEIIKALECCASCNNSMACAGCPFDENNICVNDGLAIYKSALDLINRQKAEIEEQDQAIIKALKRMGEIRSEAIKEFAERVCEGRVANDPIVIAVRYAVKEMTEGV